MDEQSGHMDEANEAMPCSGIEPVVVLQENATDSEFSFKQRIQVAVLHNITDSGDYKADNFLVSSSHLVGDVEDDGSNFLLSSSPTEAPDGCASDNDEKDHFKAKANFEGNLSQYENDKLKVESGNFHSGSSAPGSEGAATAGLGIPITENSGTILDTGSIVTSAQNKSQKRKGVTSSQSKIFNKTGDLEAGIRSWKKLCIFGPSVDDTAVIGVTGGSMGSSKSLKDTSEAKLKLSSAVGVQSNSSKKLLFALPTLDEAVVVLGQAPSGGLSGGINKQIPDGPVQIRKLLQSLSAEIASNKKTASKAARESNAEQDASSNKKSKANAAEKSEKEKEEQEDWVQCDLCSKWRRLPSQSHPNYPTDLPESWTCSLNTWDKNSSCSKPEDSFTVKELSAGAIKIRIWARRLKAADKYEQKYQRIKNSSVHSTSAIVSGGPGSVDREFGDVDWIRCSNPTCGKWRACLRSMDVKLLKEIHPKWYCWMNSWDDTRASCSAPQEGTAVRSLVSRKDWLPGAVRETKEVARIPNPMGIYAGEYEGIDDWDGDEDEPYIPESSSSSRGKGGSSSGVDSAIPALTLKSISSKGRIVRSRWNIREQQGRR